MSFADNHFEVFDGIAEAVFDELHEGEEVNLSLNAEDQTYVRFNQAKVRQASGIVQRRLSLTFQENNRRLLMTIDLGGRLEHDRASVRSMLERCRAEAKVLPEDPFVVPMENNGSSESHHRGSYPPAGDCIGQIAGATPGLDFTGLLSKGPQIRAVRNSRGQNHRFSTDSFFVDYSLFMVNVRGENKAVKVLYAGRDWSLEGFAETVENGKKQFEWLRLPAHRLSPGDYRVYLAPSAVEKIVHMFSWGAASYDAWKKGNSALHRWIEGQAEFSRLFTLKENFNLGLAPRFNSLGELAPVELPIAEQGRLKNLLVSSRSAKEYGVLSNGADSAGWLGEGLRSPEVSGGELDEPEALQRLHTGLYIGNLHYLNWSDTQNARITGMTRHACFWVENGEIIAPIGDLRFDESLYRIFGSGLESLTREAHVILSTDTYYRRALGGCKVPGAIVEGFRFTL